MTAPRFTVEAHVAVTVVDEDGNDVTRVIVNEQDGPNAGVKALAESVLAVATDRVARMLVADFGEVEQDKFPTVSPDVQDIDLTGLPSAPDDLGDALRDLIAAGCTEVRALEVHSAAARRGSLLSAATITTRLVDVAGGRWQVPGISVTYSRVDHGTGENIYRIAKADR